MTLLEPNENNQLYSDTPQTNKKNKKRLVLIIIPVVVILILSAVGLIFYSRNSNLNFLSRFKDRSSSESATLNIGEQNDVEKVTREVNKIMLLPDETPILATVTDLEKVKNQVFFARAAVGDKVLIYMQAKKAILYRPSDKLIIEVGAVNDQTSGQVAGENITVTEPTPIPETTKFLTKTTPSPSPSPTSTPKSTPTVDFSTEF